jgi:hypothetical protein
MINALKKNHSKFLLIGKINGLSTEVKRARTCLRNAKKQEYTWTFAYRKRVVGIDIRHHLLAYAFLRGVPYRLLEANCREDNKPSIKSIFQIVEAHAPKWIPYDKFTKTGGPYSVKEEDIIQWLTK